MIFVLNFQEQGPSDDREILDTYPYRMIFNGKFGVRYLLLF